MTQFLKRSTRLFFGLLFMFGISQSQGSLALTASRDPHVLIIFDPTRMSDAMQLRGIADALQRYIAVASVQEVPIERKEQWIKKIASIKETAIILTSNREGIDLVQTIRTHRPKNPKLLILAHSSHQILPDHSKLAGKADVIALPRHAVTLSQVIRLFPSRVVLTRGVAHGLSGPAVIRALREPGAVNIPEHVRYLTVILGGDADKPEGGVLFYKPEEASKVAHYAAQRARETGAHLLVLNSPRTGRYDPELSERGQKLTERLRVHQNDTLDPVTQAFMDGLHTKGFPSKNVTLYNFQWGKPDAYVFALSATITHPGSHILLPGEAVSRISECVDIFPKGMITVYQTAAMHDTHKQYVSSEWREGSFNLLSPDMNLNLSPKKASPKSPVSAAEVIAKAIIQVLKVPVTVGSPDYP